MIVVIDTNIFVRELLLLNGGIGPLFLHFLRQKQGRIFIPGILRREYLEQSIETVRDARREIESRLARIHAIAGELMEHELPADNRVQEGVEARLRELAPLVCEAPTSDEIVIAAAHRAMDKKLPCTKSDHGLKDCLIWESILRLPKGSEVHLATHDKAFFEGDQIARSLLTEAEQQSLSVRAHNSLDNVLKLLQDGQPPLNLVRVQTALESALQTARQKLVVQWNLGSILEAACHLVPYFTERLDKIYVTFTQAYSFDTALIEANEIDSPVVTISGSFIWIEDSGALEQLQIASEKLKDATDKVIRENATIYVESGALHVGRRRIPFRTHGALLGK